MDNSEFKQRSAELILRLYELRREETIRGARDWFMAHFHPRTSDEVLAMWLGPSSARYRMVTTYWEMAATFVVNGALDADMLHQANTEHVGVIAKLESFLPELRQKAGVPDYLMNLEQIVRGMPGSEIRLDAMRRYLKLKAKQAGVEV